MATPLQVAGDAMETLKMKIFLLKKENTDVSEKMALAEKVINDHLNANLFWFIGSIPGQNWG